MPLPPPGTSLYFIALIPSSPFFEEAQALKEYFRDQYHSKASLNSPPHITLHMPFQWKEKKEEKLVEVLAAFSSGKNPFTISFNNFSCFAPKVIYIDIASSESLTTLQRELYRFCKTELNLFNAQYRDLPFHPHITLAFRDLKKDQFSNAWAEFQEKKFSGNFPINKITLLKHDGKAWQLFRDFHF
jgi:2'-5' RNA ligase